MKIVILAGGKGIRIGGKKALVPFLNKPLIYWVFQKVKEFSSPVYISVKNEEQAKEIEYTLIKENIDKKKFFFIKDLIPKIEGPVSGIFSAINFFPKNEILLFTAVDQPLIKEETIKYLSTLSYIFCNKFVITTKGKDKILPFPSIFPCYLVEEIKNFIFFAPQKSLFRLFSYLKSKEVIFFISHIKIHYENFININTLEELRKFEQCFSQKLKIQKI